MKRLPLSKGQFAIIDDSDFDELNQFKWTVTEKKHSCYAYRAIKKNGHQTNIYLHRQIMGFPIEKQVDHVNGNGLDNRRSNLRLATQTQQKANTKLRRDNKSGLKGVSWNRKLSKWQAQLCVAGKRMFLGLFTDPIEAHRKYKSAATEHFGEYARTE